MDAKELTADEIYLSNSKIENVLGNTFEEAFQKDQETIEPILIKQNLPDYVSFFSNNYLRKKLKQITIR